MKIMPRMFSAEASFEMYEENDISYEYVLQRDGGQWTSTQKNNLIDSILRGFIIPNIWALEESQDRFIIVDGKQRLSTIFSYLNDEWKLAKSFEPIYYKGKFYDVGGKMFSELDPTMQKIIKLYPINYSIMLDFDEDQIEEQFMRLNSGTPFKPTQKNRVALGTQVAPKFDKKVLNHPFWDRCAPIIAKSKTDAKLGVTLETLMLLTDFDANGNGSGEVMKFAEYYRDNYKDSDLDEVASLLDLLDECYPTDEECVHYLKKLHIPALMVVTKTFQEMLAGERLFNGKGRYKFSKEDFENWLRVWTTEQYKGDYFEKGCKDGTTKKKKVEARVKCIKNNFLNHANGYTCDFIESVMGEDFDWEHGDYSCLNDDESSHEDKPTEIVQTNFVGIFGEEESDNTVVEVVGDDGYAQTYTENGDEYNEDCSG